MKPIATVSRMLVIAIVGLALSSAAQAQTAGSWPTGTVKIVVPFPPGGGADALPRVLTEHLSKLWNQPVVIENRAGAGGNAGAEVVARAAPDGYTLLSAPTPVFAVNHALYKKLNYDPTVLKPITVLGQSASVLSVHPSLGVTYGQGADRQGQGRARTSPMPRRAAAPPRI